MSERPQKSDKPSFPVIVNGVEYAATPRCATLFRHVGKAALLDYIRVQMTDRAGTYLFTDSECFDVIAQYMIDHGYPVHLNVPTVASAARAAYIRAAIRDVNDGVPADWTATQDLNDGIPREWTTET